MKLSNKWREFLLIVVLATAMGTIMCPKCMVNWSYFWKMEVIMLTIWMVMWYGNGFISHFANRYVSWLEYPAKRFVIGILGTTLFSTGAILGLALLFREIFNVDIGGGWDMVWVSIGVSLAILLFMQSREFLFSWRNIALREEKMRNELLEARYEVLKNQINPHFMFNGLNALSSLVHEDQDLAVKYIDQLAKVLRYVLQSGKQEIVNVSEELEVLESYVFLQKIRFGENLVVNINMPKDNKTIMIAPLALQMLIENAIKHNEITNDNPLTINIKHDGDHLMVSNNLKIKEIALQDSSQMGLNNIKARYKSLADQEVIVQKTDNEFIVRLPILNQAV